MLRKLSRIHLCDDEFIKCIAQEAVGEKVLDYFTDSLNFQGFAPSSGYDAIVENTAQKLEQWGYEFVQVLGFPSDGASYAWACRTEPAWDVEQAELFMVRPQEKLLARFSEKRMCLGRFSGPTDVVADLVHVNEGVVASDYAGVDVSGRMVLAWGKPEVVFARAVWERGALGLIWYRPESSPEFNDATQVVYSLPYASPETGKPVTFCFSLPYNSARELITLIEQGIQVSLHALVKSEVYASELKVATGLIKGTELPGQEIWFLGHCNHRNTGGFNNLSGYGSTLEIARVLSKLVQDGVLPRPRRTIRFFFGAEHQSVINYFYHNPDQIRRVFAAINLDMVGMCRKKTGAHLRVSRTPHSSPHFINDVAAYFVDYMEERNHVDGYSTNIFELNQVLHKKEAILAPTGSRDGLNIQMMEFQGPSDQEDLMDGSIRIPALTFSEWPDPYFHTELDNIELVDPTQVRRVVSTAGALGYYMAAAGSQNYPFLIVNSLSRAQERAGAQLCRAARMVEIAREQELPAVYYEAANVVRQAWRREREAMLSLGQMDCDLEQDDFFKQSFTRMEWDGQRALQELETVAKKRCESAGIDPQSVLLYELHDPEWAHLIPRRAEEIRGPINLNRHQYGRWWLFDRLGEFDFDGLLLAFDGLYYTYEALNCVDGKRTVRQIRDIVCAEYEPAPVEHFYDFLKLLARAGAIHLNIYPG